MEACPAEDHRLEDDIGRVAVSVRQVAELCAARIGDVLGRLEVNDLGVLAHEPPEVVVVVPA